MLKNKPFWSEPNKAGETITTLMAEKGISQGQLAELVGVSQGAISMIVTGRTVHSRFLPLIAFHLGVTYDTLIAGIPSSKAA